MSFHVVMVNPEIPPNTGNVARSCAATDSVLHLVKPLGFDMSDKAVRRAGLDYWPYVDVRVHGSLEDFLREYADSRKFFISTKGVRYYYEADYRPRELLNANEGMTLRRPMSGNTRTRSLNLANSVNIVLFEALRQTGFKGMG